MFIFEKCSYDELQKIRHKENLLLSGWTLLEKEKELDMLNQAYENHSNFMATSTEIWSELKNFTPTLTYHKGSGQAEQEQSLGEGKENITKPETKGVIKNATCVSTTREAERG